jgi:cupin 2 domain-containing protein
MRSEPKAKKLGNLFDDDAPPVTGERFEALARSGATVIERIVSSDEPDSRTYDQMHDEWVVLLRGSAELEIAGARVALTEGDHVLLPARTPHRVLRTSSGAVWLAVHVHPAARPDVTAE